MHVRRLTLTALIAVLVGAIVPTASAGASGLSEFAAGLTPHSKPAGIARGADGNVWVASYADPGRIARVTPDGAITEFTAGITPGAGPLGITAGPDGNVWFTEFKRDAVARITPQGVVTEFQLGISSDSDPQDIAAGPDGNLWFTERAGRIARITPTGIVTEFSVGMPAGAKPRGIAPGPDGNLWFTDVSSAARVGRITPAGVITMFDDAIPTNSLPYDITAGSDGNVWFTLTATSRIGRITPAGDVTIFDGLHDFALPLGIALGPDGRVWVTQLGRGRIATVDTDGTVSEHSGTPSFGALPTGITAGPGGSVWFTEPGYDLSGRIAGHDDDSDDDDHGFSGAVAVLDSVGAADSTAGLPPTMVDPPADDVDPDGAPADEQPTGSASGGSLSGAAVKEQIKDLAPADEVEKWTLPEQGETFLVAPIAGEVRVRRPGARRSGLITRASNIPAGSRIDSSGGAIAVATELPNNRFQIASFKDGRFDIEQARDGKGYTQLTLRGKTGCGGNGEPDPLLAQSSTTRKRTGRRLWASDRNGRFRTHGRDSVATVRGTEWITEDTCAGTRTTVVKGAVSVRNRHTGRTVLVKAGHSYLARRR